MAPRRASGPRRGWRTAAGYYTRSLITRVGTLELRVPQDRLGRFSTELFERYQRSEKALVGTLAEMYVQGVSTRKVKAVTEALCGHSFSASSISAVNKSLDDGLKAFAERRLNETYPYLILDARYEKVREGGVIASQAVLVAVAVDGEGRRQVLAVELANRESRSSWRDFLLGASRRAACTAWSSSSPTTIAGLKAAIREVLPEAAWQRCYVHFLQQRAGLRAAQGRRRLPAGVALVLRPARHRRGAPRPRRLAGQMAGQVPEAVRLGRGQHRGNADLSTGCRWRTIST